MKTIDIKPNNVLIRPRVTEKAAIQGEKQNVYAFEVARGATKKSIIASVKEIYKVTPVRVHMITIPKKQVFVRGKWGVKGGGKKAYIQLKKGDKIETI